MDKFAQRFHRPSETKSSQKKHTDDVLESLGGLSNVGEIFEHFEAQSMNSSELFLYGTGVARIHLPRTYFKSVYNSRNKHKGSNTSYDMGIQIMIKEHIEKGKLIHIELDFHPDILHSVILDSSYSNNNSGFQYKLNSVHHPIIDLFGKCISEDRIVSEEEWNHCVTQMKLLAL